MTILIQYGPDAGEDKEEAEELAKYIGNNFSVTTVVADASGVNFGSFDGVLVVGGQRANPVYQELVDQGKFQPVAEPVWDPILQYESAGRVTEAVQVDGTWTQGIAGYTKEDTEALVKWYLGKADAQQDPLNFIGAGIDDYMEKVTGQDIEDPTDPIIEDPEDPDDGTDDPTYDGTRYTFSFSYADESQVVNEGKIANLTESAIENKIVEFGWLFTGWDLVDVRLDEGNNNLEIEMLKEGSITVIAVATVLVTLIGGLSLNFALDEQTKQKKLEQDTLEDSEETLKEIANDESVDEETRESARKALIELEGKAPEEIGDSGDGSGSGGLFGEFQNVFKYMIILLFLVLIMNQTD